MEELDPRHSTPVPKIRVPLMATSTPLISSNDLEFEDADLSSSYPSAKYFITPAIGKRHLTRIPQLLDSQPKKGILKRGSVPNTVSSDFKDESIGLDPHNFHFDHNL